MKKVFGYILSFNLMIFIALLIMFNIFELSIKKSSTFNYLNKSKYYEVVKDRLNNELNNYVFEENLRNDCLNYFNNDLIRYDLYKELHNNTIDHKENIKSIVLNYTKEKDIIESYSNKINDIYNNSLFPIREYNILYRLYFGFEKILLVDIFLIILIFSSLMVLYLLNYSKEYIRISFLSIGTFFIITYIFSRFIFIRFSFLDIYFKHILSLNINIYLLIGLVIMLIFILKYKKGNYLTHKKLKSN